MTLCGLAIARRCLLLLLADQRRSSAVVAVEVKKSQHKYIIGVKGQNLHEILAETGVSVEVPPLDTPSDTITLRGDADKLGIALTAVYTKVGLMCVSQLFMLYLHSYLCLYAIYLLYMCMVHAYGSVLKVLFY